MTEGPVVPALCESFEYLKHSKNLTTKDTDTLQKKTFEWKQEEVTGIYYRNYEYDPARN